MKARDGAFSLVEVVLAIGVLTFALTSMIGLLGVAMQSDKSSGSATALAAMSQQVYNTLRSIPFASLPANTNFYFDSDGSECGPETPVYTCRVEVAGDPDLAAGNLARVQMRFTWPGNTNVVQAAIANHGF